MRTYRVQVLDGSGVLLVAASLRCRDDDHALSRLGDLALPPGRVVVSRGGSQVAEFSRPRAA